MANNNNDRTSSSAYNLAAITDEGTKLKLIGGLRDGNEARYLALQIEQRFNLQPQRPLVPA